MQDNRRADGSGKAIQAGKYRADRQRDRSGFPEGYPERSGIQNNRKQRDTRKDKNSGNAKPIADEPAISGRSQAARFLGDCFR